MTRHLDHILKVRRAKGHLDRLNETIEAFIQDETHESVTELDPKSGEYVVRLNSDPPSVPLVVSPAIGDVLFNLRSGLDHLVYALAKRNNPACSGEKTEFPIFCDPVLYASESPKRIGDLSQAAQDTIERCQPYHAAPDPRRTYLWALHDLNRIDKHRLLHVVNFVIHQADMVWEAPDGGVISVRAAEAPPGGFVKGTEIGRFRVSRGAPPADMNEKLRLASDIRFGPGIQFPEAQNESVLGLLRRIVSHVEVICGVFNPFFS